MHLLLSPTIRQGRAWVEKNVSLVHSSVRRSDLVLYINGNGWCIITQEEHVRGLRCNPGDIIFLLPGFKKMEILAHAKQCFAFVGKPTVIQL